MRQLLRCRNSKLARQLKIHIVNSRGQKWYRMRRRVNVLKRNTVELSSRLTRSAQSEKTARVEAFNECGNPLLGYHSHGHFLVRPCTKDNTHACIRNYARRFHLEKVIFAKSFSLSCRDRKIMARTNQVPCRRAALELVIGLGLLGYVPGHVQKILDQKYKTLSGLGFRLNLCLNTIRSRTNGLSSLVLSHQSDLISSRTGEREGFLRVLVRKLEYQRQIPRFARIETVISNLRPFGENRRTQ